jgi:Domain of unknown function (DUF3943)
MAIAIALVACAAPEARAVQVGAVAPRQLRAVARADSAAFGRAPLGPANSTRQGRNRSFIIPALEVIGFNAALNLVDRLVLDTNYQTNLTSIKKNLRRSWVIDSDPFKINQFLHPYQGAIYNASARSAGLGYWPSLGYSMAGSIMWEIAGERSPPSRNDFIASGIAGSFFGEMLFRMANLVLERAPDGHPRFQRQLAAAVISPAVGFNRLVFGQRFDTVYSSRDAVYYRRWQFGASATALNVLGLATEVTKNEAIIDLSVDYGLPGKTGYTYSRPFDYFAAQATGSSANGFENIMTRGLIAGRAYGTGHSYRGVWGLYGSYDYIAPQLFRVSTTALSLGTTGQRWLGKSVALQGTALLGAGFAAVGTIHGGERDWRYGLAPQALLASRVILGDRVSVDLTGREYFVSAVGNAQGHDNIIRADALATYRLHGQNAIAIKYLFNRRDAFYSGLGKQAQIRGTLSILYTLLGHDRFGAVEWR